MKFDELCGYVINEFASATVGYRLTKEAEQKFEKEQNEFKDLSPRESSVLGAIFINPGATRKQVANIVGKQDRPLSNPQTTGFVIKALVSKGLVELTTPAAYEEPVDQEPIDKPAPTGDEDSGEEDEGPIEQPFGGAREDEPKSSEVEDVIYNAMKQIGEPLTLADIIDVVAGTDVGKRFKDPMDPNAIKYSALKRSVEKTLTQLKKDGAIGVNIHITPVKYYIKDDDREDSETPELEFGPDVSKEKDSFGFDDVERALGRPIERPESDSPIDFG